MAFNIKSSHSNNTVKLDQPKFLRNKKKITRVYQGVK